MFAYRSRIHKDLFSEVLKRGKTLHSPLFSLCYLKAENKAFSVVASKKVSKGAVVRNRNKRRVRHALKKLEAGLPQGAFIVFIKKDLTDVPYPKLSEELAKLLVL